MGQYALDRIRLAIQALPHEAMDETARNLMIHDYNRAVEDIQGGYAGFSNNIRSLLSLQIISTIMHIII